MARLTRSQAQQPGCCAAPHDAHHPSVLPQTTVVSLSALHRRRRGSMCSCMLCCVRWHAAAAPCCGAEAQAETGCAPSGGARGAQAAGTSRHGIGKAHHWQEGDPCRCHAASVPGSSMGRSVQLPNVPGCLNAWPCLPLAHRGASERRGSCHAAGCGCARRQPVAAWP